jgi:outer membrane protein assembly factor BamB
MRISHLAAGCLVAALVLPSALAAEESPWRKLPPLPGRTDYSGPIALEGDTLWATGGNSVAYWTGSEWRVPSGPLLKGGQYLTQFFGGRDRPLLFSQRTASDHVGELYLLRDSEVSLLTTFHYDSATVPPLLGVTARGEVFSMSSQGIGVFRGGAWQNAPRLPRSSAVFQTADAVYFYDAGARKLLRFQAETGFQEQEVAIGPTKKDAMFRSTQWGPDRALVIELGQPKVRGFVLATGQECDVGRANEVIGDLRPAALHRLRDGSVWILCYRTRERPHPVFRLRPTGECAPATELDKVAWSQRSSGGLPNDFLEARDGALWIGGYGESLTRVAGGQITRFGSETGYNLSDCTELVEDSRGRIYAANIRGIYAWPASSPAVHDLPPPRVPQRPQATWIYRREKRPPLVRAWKPGQTIYAVSNRPRSRGQMLIAIDAAAGRTLFTRDIPPENSHALPWLFRETDGGLLEFAMQGQIVRLSAKTGEVQDEIALPHDQRIAPLPLDGGYVIVPRPRGTDLVRVDEQQQQVWRAPLPGYVQLHPTVVGRHAIVQTRGGSYGGQQTVCIRLDDGAIVWQDETNAYGCGIDYFDEERFLIDANCHMTPQIGEGWLIARNPASGQRLWDYRQSGLLHHPPLVDRRTGRVYAAFHRGEVVCLRGEDGSVVWQQRMSENALRDGAADSYHEAWSPHSLHDGRLYVVDECLTLHALDAATGKFQASVALVPPIEAEPQPKVTLVAAPWIVGNQVFAALSEGVVSCRLPE